MPATSADTWKLESFLDSLIGELDRAQDTLSVKGVTRKLTYTVQDVAMDLFVFPRFEGGRLRFDVAKPGEEGASKISFSLGSITDRQIQETGNRPPSEDDIALDEVEDLDPEVKTSLQAVGVRSARDVERLSERQVDVGKLVADKSGGTAKVGYRDLAAVINKARRRQNAPRVQSLGLGRHQGRLTIAIDGENLAVEPAIGFPLAFINDRPVEVVDAGPAHMRLSIDPSALRPGDNAVRLALDPYAMVDFSVVGPEQLQ
ncbi:hypothetical protein [Sphingobium yanoikuyae]|uniref:hypothetical protein n=1 Tax=Sphingobium yanoikuyae TaxID=13690 RepID=UPI0028B11C53|nr:hypothetical protein [Sphingobium yanoikuyae]